MIPVHILNIRTYKLLAFLLYLYNFAYLSRRMGCWRN